MPRINTTTADIVPDERFPPLPALPRTGSAAGPSALERAVPTPSRGAGGSDWRQQMSPYAVNGSDMQPPGHFSQIRPGHALPLSYPSTSRATGSGNTPSGLHSMMSTDQNKASRGFPRSSPMGMPLGGGMAPTGNRFSAPPPSRTGAGGGYELPLSSDGPRESGLGFAHNRPLPASMQSGTSAFASLQHSAPFPMPALPPPPPQAPSTSVSTLSPHDERILAPFLKPRAKRRRDQDANSGAAKNRRSSETVVALDGAAAGELESAAKDDDDDEVKGKTASSGSPEMPAETPGSSDPNLKRNRPPSRISNRPGPVMIDGKKRYPCGTCSLTFSTSGHAARHSRIHRGSRPYVCTFPGCGNRFSRQDNSLQHYKTHVSASRSSRDNELGYLLKSAAEIAQEDRYIALGKKALLDVTAIAVMHDVFDSKGKKTGEKLVRCVGADLATRLPRLKHEAAPPAHVIPTTGPQTASHQAAAALESHEATSSLPGTMVGGDPMGSVPVQSRLGPASAPQVSADGFVGSATASSISPGDGRGGPSHEIAYSTSVGGTTDGRAYGTIISNTVPVAFSDGSAVGMGAGVPTVGPGGTPASAPEGMPASEFGPASSAFPRGGNSGGTTDRILPVGASTLPQGGMAPYHPSPTQSRPTGPYGDVTQHNAGGAMPIPSPVASSDQIAMSRQTNFVHTAAPGSNPNASPAGPLMSQQQSPVVGAGSGMYGDGTSGGNVGSQGLVYNSWNPQVPASHRYYPPPRQTWRPSGPQQHPQGMVYHQGGYGLSPPRPYYPQASPSYPVGPSPPGMQGQQPPVPPGNDQGWRPRNEYGYN